MTSLVRRATPRQVVVLRMVAGAVRNVAHTHPDWEIDDPRLPMSIAKRATGTLSAGWPAVLAASRVAPSDKAVGESPSSLPPPHPGSTPGSLGRRAASEYHRRRAPLRTLHAAVGRLAGLAKRAGQTERNEALVEALRLIDMEMKRLDNPHP